MRNIYKFLREKTAKITVSENVITIKREDGQTATFEANKGKVSHLVYGIKSTNNKKEYVSTRFIHFFLAIISLLDTSIKLYHNINNTQQ